MKRILSILLLVIIYSCKVKDVPNPEIVQDLPSYVYPLKTTGQGAWNTDGFTISCNQGEGYTMTSRSFQYFELSVEFKPEGDVNSGIFFGCEDENFSATGCYEANIWDDHPNQDFRTGSIVTKALPLCKVDTYGKWNTFKISAKKGSIMTWVNGQLTSEIKGEININPSVIGFQKFGGGEIQFRNLTIKEI